MAKTYYVSASGSDNNNGFSINSAFESLQKAADLSQPGDIVYVMNGTYRQTASSDGNVLTIRHSGTANAWITYKAYPGQQPKIVSTGWSGIEIQGADYITVEGFELEGNINLATIVNASANAQNSLSAR